jgi:hypothetical protein
MVHAASKAASTASLVVRSSWGGSKADAGGWWLGEVAWVWPTQALVSEPPASSVAMAPATDTCSVSRTHWTTSPLDPQPRQQ